AAAPAGRTSAGAERPRREGARAPGAHARQARAGPPARCPAPRARPGPRSRGRRAPAGRRSRPPRAGSAPRTPPPTAHPRRRRARVARARPRAAPAAPARRAETRRRCARASPDRGPSGSEVRRPVEQPAALRLGNRFAAPAYAELLEGPVEDRLHRLGADVEPRRDLAVREALCDVLQDLDR